MFRTARQDSGGRTFMQIARATILRSNDKPRLQEVDLELMRDEKKTHVETFGQYGFKSVPLPPTGKEKAEAIVAFLGGNRSHAVVLATDDRRYRPKDWKPGESGLYDDQGQAVKVSRDGIKLDGGKDKKPQGFSVGNASLTIEDGKITLTVGGSKIIITDGNIYTVGKTHVGVDGEQAGPLKIKTIADTAAKQAFTKDA